MATMQTQVKVNSIDVTSKIRPIQIPESKDNAITTVKIQFLQTVNTLVELKQLQTFEVWRGTVTATDEKIFSGYVTKVRANGQYYDVDVSDKLYRAITTVVNQIYDLTSPQGGVVSEIFKDLINTYTGLTANNTSVQNSGTVNILQKFVVRRANVYEQLKKLADALGWQFYYRPDTNLVYFEPRGYTVNTNTLTIGDNIINLPAWSQDTSEFANDITCVGKPVKVTFIDTYTGDGSTSVFSLTKGKPVSIEVTVAGAIKTGGLTTATSGAQYTVDTEAQTITFTSGNIPTGGQAIVITYDYIAALITHLTSPASITKYVLTVQKVYQFSEVKTLADLEQKTRELITKIDEPFLSTTLRAKASQITTLGLHVGQRVRVVDNRNKIAGQNIDQQLVVLKRTIRLPSDYDEIDVGDREWKLADWEAGVEERLHKLFDEAMQSQDIVLEILELSRILTLKRKTLVLTRYHINDSFILDHPINGLMYNSDETNIYSDFEAASDWTASGSATPTFSNDSTSGHFWTGNQGVNATWAGTGTVTFTNTVTTKSNLSNVVGVTSGTPTQGTAAIWCWTSDNPATSMLWRIGNDASNYRQYSGQTFAQRQGISSTFALTASDRTYIMFDLDSPSSSVGTPTWSNPSYNLFALVVSAAGTATFDYMTLSKNSSLGLNGMGDRTTVRNALTYTY